MANFFTKAFFVVLHSGRPGRAFHRRGSFGQALTLTLALFLAGPAAFAQAPANDDPCGTTVLPVGPACTTTLATNVGATATTGVAAPGCSDYSGGDVWFSVTVPATGNLLLTTSAATGSPVYDTGLAVYSGTCGSLTEMDCNDNYSDTYFARLLLSGLPPGQVLLVRTFVYANDNLGTYNVCAQEIPPCSAPTNAAISNLGAAHATVTFAENLLANGDYEVSYTPAGGSAQTRTGNHSPIDLTNLQPSTAYTVTVASTCGGSLTAPSAAVSFTTMAAPANDECAGAVALTVGTTCTPLRISNIDASASTSVPDPGCADYDGGDMWYSVVVPSNGIVALETGEVSGSSVNDTGLAVYSGACGSLSLLACDDNNGHSYTSYIRLTGQTPGSVLYVRAWSNGNYTHGDFTICATTDDANPTTEWLGGSTDWFAASNWSAGVPTATANAHVPNVPSGHYPALTTAGLTAEVHSLVIDKYADFTHTAGTLAVSGNLICRAYGNFTSSDYNIGLTTGGTIALRGTGPQQLTGLSEIYDLTMDATGPATLTTEMRLDHQITMTQGVLSTGDGLIEMYGDNPFNEFFSTARIAETESGYILGRIQYRGFVPDENPVDFGGLGLTITSDINAPEMPGFVQLNRFTGSAPAAVGARAGITRYFAVEASNTSNLNLSLAFDYFDHDRNGIADANLGLYTAPGTSGPWVLSSGTARQAPSAAGAPSTVVRSGLSTLASALTLGSTAAPLPVELASFTAEAAGAGSWLRWTTASEKNNAYFEVEASADGRTFDRIGRVAGHGSTAHATAYELRDASLARYASKLVYYRLRQVDTNGQFSFSPVRTVAVAGTAAALVVNAFPVPFTESLTVRVSTATSGPVRLTLRDAWGRELVQQNTAIEAGTHDLVLTKANSLAPGIYLLTVEQNGNVQQLKVSRQ